MELVIQRNEFLKGLQMVQGVVIAKKAIPILSNALIEFVEDGIWIYATDLEVGIKGFYRGEVKGEGSFSLPARKLFDIVRELPNKPIKITLEKEGENEEWVRISCGKYYSQVPCLSADLYPSFPTYGDDYLVSFDPHILKEMIKKTIFSVSSDDSRLALNGTLIEIEGHVVTMASTDGHRLSCIVSDNPAGSEKKHTLIISRKTSTELLKFLEDVDEPILFGVSENHAVFRRGKMILVSRLLIEGQFPDFKAVIPANNEKYAKINRESLIHTLKRVSLLSEENSRMVRLSLDKGEMELLSNASEIGEAKEKIEVEYDDEPVSIGLNAKYILDILGAIDDDNVLLALNNSTTPAMFCPNKNGSYKCVIMPVRLQ